MHPNRHPWETARLRALQLILAPEIFEGIKVLDVGCGDGFISGRLFDHLRSKDITAVDIHLSDEQMLELRRTSADIRYRRDMPAGENYDLVLLLDVIEHMESDLDFLTRLVDRYLSDKGRVMITIPAFQSLYGPHDRFLGHYRRYNLTQLIDLTRSCGLEVISSGYLFFSLLLPKLVLSKFLNIRKVSEGVGSWNGGKWITTLLGMLLNIDNRLLLQANRLGIRIPGLTGWVLCEKRG
ncbi:MAG: methyltransferase domain-containing protein [Desulfuromonadales bacterium]